MLVQQLQTFRKTLEALEGPEDWLLIQAPLFLVLADICDALDLASAKEDILGAAGMAALQDFLHTGQVPRCERPRVP